MFCVVVNVDLVVWILESKENTDVWRVSPNTQTGYTLKINQSRVGNISWECVE